VLTGHGNSGTGTEGVILDSAVGTNLRGPCLPKNPALADFLIAAAVGRLHPGAELMPLRDELEQAAHDDCLQRVLPAGRIRRVRPGRAAGTGPARQPRLTRPQRSPQRASRTTDAATRP
jgi:hypothetical protein